MENLDTEQSFVLQSILAYSEIGDMQNWEDFHLQDQILDEELFKFKQANETEPEDERVNSPFSVSSTTSAGTLADHHHDISTVPNWMTNGLSFDATVDGGLVSNIESSQLPSELRGDPDSTAPASVAEDEFSEENLKSISVKELNRLVKLKGLNKDQVTQIKYLRRTIKNRGYAQNCRIKRIKQKQGLEEQNSALQKQVETLQLRLANVTTERDEIKKKYKQLKKFVFATSDIKNKIYLAS